MGMGRQSYAPAALPLGKIPGTHYMEGWLGHGASLDGCGKTRLHCDLIPGRPVRSLSL